MNCVDRRISAPGIPAETNRRARVNLQHPILLGAPAPYQDAQTAMEYEQTAPPSPQSSSPRQALNAKPACSRTLTHTVRLILSDRILDQPDRRINRSFGDDSSRRSPSAGRHFAFFGYSGVSGSVIGSLASFSRR